MWETGHLPKNGQGKMMMALKEKTQKGMSKTFSSLKKWRFKCSKCFREIDSLYTVYIIYD